MHEPYPLPAKGRPAPAFTPVPLRARIDGWTPERQRAFIRALAETRSVGRAAAVVGMSRASAYRLRDRPGASSFAAAWDAAAIRSETRTSAKIEADASSLWDRALNGRVVPMMRKGEQVGERIRPDDAALMTLMRRFDRARAVGRAYK